MRIALLYPPPWKIPASGQTPDPNDGPPPDAALDWDYYQVPYGLLSLAAQAIRAGHLVKVFNLASFSWDQVEALVAGLDAELWGMSCWTANRRGVALTAQLIKDKHPDAHVVIGGPHASALPKEMLEHYSAIDTVCVGESEETFLELIARLEAKKPVQNLPGAWTRDGNKVLPAPHRANIKDLDALANPHDYFNTHITMTARGCPWACTFCGAENTWGRGFRGLSVKATLDMLETMVSKLPVKIVFIKDDTFTTNKKRVLELCRGIRERGLKFLWSCDTRVDVLEEELLKEMRLAGCERLSLGVETGSQKILDAIQKKITIDEIIASTSLAKKYGITVRYFMMLGNRGETEETFRETLAFLERARPHQYVFCPLHISPGTTDFQDAVAAGWLDAEWYFTSPLQEHRTTFDATPEVTELLNTWFNANSGMRNLHEPDVAEYRAILERIPNHAPAHLDLAGAYFRQGDFDMAEVHVLRAEELGYPLPGILQNYYACLARVRGDFDGMFHHLLRGEAVDPQHKVLLENTIRATTWLTQNGAQQGLPLPLLFRHDFGLIERWMQPGTPGPLPPDWNVWTTTEPSKPTTPMRAEEYFMHRRKLPVWAPSLE